MIEYLPLVLTGLSIAASITYYSMVLRNANQTRRTQLFLEVKNKFDDPDFRLRIAKLLNHYQWETYEEYNDKYGVMNNPEASSEITCARAAR